MREILKEKQKKASLTKYKKIRQKRKDTKKKRKKKPPKKKKSETKKKKGNTEKKMVGWWTWKFKRAAYILLIDIQLFCTNVLICTIFSRGKFKL